jgi:hypothetical protein
LENFYLFLHKQLNQNWLRAKPNASSFTTARTFERKPVGAAANISAHLLRGFAYLALRARLHPGHHLGISVPRLLNVFMANTWSVAVISKVLPCSLGPAVGVELD